LRRDILPHIAAGMIQLASGKWQSASDGESS
jgi:hypothetical protein